MNYKIQAVLDAGFSDGDQEGIIPFLCIDGVAVSYTFGIGIPCEENPQSIDVQFDGQLGELKAQLFRSMFDTLGLIVIDSKRPEYLKESMRKHLETIKAKGIGNALFVIPKHEKEEAMPFYAAFGIESQDAAGVNGLISARELGTKKLSAPFAYVADFGA